MDEQVDGWSDDERKKKESLKHDCRPVHQTLDIPIRDKGNNDEQSSSSTVENGMGRFSLFREGDDERNEATKPTTRNGSVSFFRKRPPFRHRQEQVQRVAKRRVFRFGRKREKRERERAVTMFVTRIIIITIIVSLPCLLLSPPPIHPKHNNHTHTHTHTHT